MIKDNSSKNASWFNINITENKKEIKVTLDNETETLKFVVEKTLREKTTDRYDYTIKSNSDNYTIDYGTGEYKNSVVLEEGGISVRKSKNYPSSYFFNDGNRSTARESY